MRLQGVEEVLKKLQAFEKRTQTKEIRKALRAGGQVIRKQAIENAKRVDDPLSDETIWKNIVIRTGKGQGARIRIGILGGARNMKAYGEFKGKGKGNPGGDTWYWRFIEFGVPSRGIGARPLLRHALLTKQQPALDAIIARLKAILES